MNLVRSSKLRFHYNTKFGVFIVNYWFLSVSNSMLLLLTWYMLCFVVVEFKERQLILQHVLFDIKCKISHWKFQKSLWKLSVRELFPNKVTVNRPSNNNEFLQWNFSEIKLKMSYLASSKKKFSEYFLMVAPKHYC